MYNKNIKSIIKNWKISNLEKHACQTMVAMETLIAVDNALLYQIVPRSLFSERLETFV